jgi:type II secretory pathway component HofQ
LTRSLVVLAITALIPAWPSIPQAQGPKLVQVLVEFRQSGAQSREAVQGKSGLVITERGSVRSRAQLGAEDTQTRTQRSTGIFTIVQDGGEATLSVATQVPYPHVAYYQDYATGAGYVAAGVAFKDVGTSLKVRATVLPGGQVRVRLTPVISHVSADGAGVIEFTEASTELVVPSGRAIVLGGATSQTHAVTRQILGIDERRTGNETTVLLTATIQ